MTEFERIINVDIKTEMERSFLDYSMSVIVSRALPDARDGLKPVHRRILYTLFENNVTANSPFRKCADTVGSVLGRYHPHGDSGVYDALVRMAQSFSMRYTLVEGHGNFGSVDGDPPAAYRYTEARMSKISHESLTDIEKETVDFVPNYDGRLTEPSVLPSRFPNLLVNGSTGIAVGMATNIPSHNLGEIVDAICLMIDNPDVELSELMTCVAGPDFPTGGKIMGISGIHDAYNTGRGKIILRSTTEIINENGREKIHVTEIPYQVNKARLIENIAAQIKDKKIDSITKIEDYSDRDGMCIEITVRHGVSAQVALNQLYNFTQLQIVFGVIMLAIVNGEPKVLNLKQCLKIYIDFQVEIITRRTKFELKKIKTRVHILEALKIAIDNIDLVISILRSSKSIPEAKTKLIERFEFSDIQTQAIIQMPLGKLTGLERIKIQDEITELLAKIVELQAILDEKSKLLEILKKEILEIKQRFNDKRRTEILNSESDMKIIDLIPHGDRVIIKTKLGYIKTQDPNIYRSQRRGGRGITGVIKQDSDVADEILIADSHDYILFFTNFGKVYRCRCFEIPESTRISKGINIVNLLNLAKDETISAFIKVEDFDADNFLVMITKFGVIKRTKLDAFNKVRKNGLISLDLDEGDELSWIKVTDGNQNILLASQNGKAIRFRESDIRVIGRSGRGVRGIKLAKNDYIVGMATAEDTDLILTIASNGNGRISLASDYRIQSRGGLGLTNYHTSKHGPVACILNINLDQDLIIIASNGIVIRVPVDTVRQCSRPSKGVRIMKLEEDSRIVSVVNIPKEN
ncbi:MAG: DNA gyrase subunit A [Candidatus Improbicoccus devescovinae]|nr:MAG: DNA gyrase subunit A [Candidatus Improbicoccus devescovinae]